MGHTTYEVYDFTKLICKARTYDEALEKANELYTDKGAMNVSIMECTYIGRGMGTYSVSIWNNGRNV